MAKRYSQEWKDNISKSKMGHPVSEEVRKILRKVNLGRKLSQEHKEKISKGISGDRNPMKRLELRKQFSERMKGKNGPGWKGGISKPNELARKSMEYRAWRKSVFERDNYTCQECGIRSGNGKKAVLQADHIKPWAYFPQDRYDIDNGRTLCVSCHKKTWSYGSNGNKGKKKAVEYLESITK